MSVNMQIHGVQSIRFGTIREQTTTRHRSMVINTLDGGRVVIDMYADDPERLEALFTNEEFPV